MEAGLRHTPALVKALVNYSKLYGSVLIKNLQGFNEYVDSLYTLVDEWETFTRIALVYPKRVTTPYFPVGATVDGEGISIALRYVDLVEEVLGVRLIPSTSSPGDRVRLNRFNYIPVIRL